MALRRDPSRVPREPIGVKPLAVHDGRGAILIVNEDSA
jgi:hypothetical protein